MPKDSARGRAASPPASKGATSAEVGKKNQAEAEAAKKPKFEPPPRPEGLRSTLLTLYAALVVAVFFFVSVGEGLYHPIPEGMYELKNKTLIKISDFDAAELGPFPKCHPHFNEHEGVGEDGSPVWIKNDKVGSAGPFPVGHPENPEFVKMSDAKMRQETVETRFTWTGLQPNLHLLALATLCVLIGCKHSVWLFTEPSAEQRAEGGGQQVLQSGDAYMFPVMGSCMLFGMFILYKYVGFDWVKLGVSCIIVTMCAFGVATNATQFSDLVRGRVASPLLTIPYFDKKVFSAEIVGFLIGIAMAGTFLWTKNWIVNNVFGISFCIMGIKMIGLSSYQTGAIMLVGLFFYDVFWVFGSKSVFGSNVMVTVAKGVEAPIKLMFPRALGGCGTLQHSMLGLGDIVVPGIFLAFLAKWDAVKIAEGAYNSFRYLNISLVAYFLSLITTLCVMLFFNAAQPALLYIVPYVLVSSVGTALIRGEFGALWAYVIPDEEEEEANGSAAEKKNE